MEILYPVLAIATLILSIYALVSYFQNNGSLNKNHEAVMLELAPNRTLSTNEIDTFEQIFKKQLPEKCPVYKTTGAVGYISLKVQGSESRTYVVNHIKIHHNSVSKLEKNLGITLEKQIPDEALCKEKIENLNIRLASKDLSEEDYEKEVQKLIDTYCNHTIEFVFNSPEVTKKPAYIISFDGKKILT